MFHGPDYRSFQPVIKPILRRYGGGCASDIFPCSLFVILAKSILNSGGQSKMLARIDRPPGLGLRQPFFCRFLLRCPPTQERSDVKESLRQRARRLFDEELLSRLSARAERRALPVRQPSARRELSTGDYDYDLRLRLELDARRDDSPSPGEGVELDLLSLVQPVMTR